MKCRTGGCLYLWLFPALAVMGCAAADTGGQKNDGGGTLSDGSSEEVDHGVPDLSVPNGPIDLSVIDLSMIDLLVVCDVDAGDKVCGNGCIPSSGCCVDTDCAAVANGATTCDKNSHTCKTACTSGFRLCNGLCIAGATLDGGQLPDGGLGSSCCVDTDCPSVGQVCPSAGGVCACPVDTKLCPLSNSCIPVGNCCASSECAAPANGKGVCDNGTCGITCDNGFNTCGNQCQPAASQCCTAKNCSTNNITPACTTGTCTGTCNPGFADCNLNKLTDGCEIDTQNDPLHCGSCPKACSPNNIATPTCGGGVCNGTCNPGFADCDGDKLTNGCEINTQNDPNNCSSCGMKCTIANGVAGCANGMCTVGSCTNGYQDCNGQVSDGCETHTAVDANSCGTCGNVCNLPNATASCTGGTCTIAACNPGYTDCNNNPLDGCEVHTSVDPLNCGTCTHQCFTANGTPGCSAGNCTIVGCNSGFGNCDGNPTNGCETNTTNNVNNCGTCGNNCQTGCVGNVAAVACNNSSCAVIACNQSYYNVDGACGNGCECKSSLTSASCGSPNDLGTLNLGQNTSFAGNLVPTGTEAYLSVTFTGNDNTGYHPRVRFTSNPGNEFQFDVLANCGGTLLNCGNEGGVSSGRTDWEEIVTSSSDYYDKVPPVGTNGRIVVHVYRRPGAPTTCSNYGLIFSN